MKTMEFTGKNLDLESYYLIKKYMYNVRVGGDPRGTCKGLTFRQILSSAPKDINKRRRR